MTGYESGAEEKLRVTRGRLHSVEMINRETVTICGVTDVEAFHEEEIVLLTEMGVIVLAGEGLHIVKLNLDEGVLRAEGQIHALEYVAESRAHKKGVFAGLFR